MGRSYGETHIKQLLAGDGTTVNGDMGMFFLKASLEAGISYTAGYPGAPTSNVMDLLGDSQNQVLEKYGIYFEPSTNEAAAATKMYLSIHEKIRGFVNWKVVGNNVAADVVAHIASSGVKGGAVILIGEDEECISTTVKMKSQVYGEGFFMPVIDPIGEASNFINLVRKSYEFSEYCNAPVMFLFRSHVGNTWGSTIAKDNKEPEVSINKKRKEFIPDLSRVPVPPDTIMHAVEKYEDRLPRAIEFIREHKLNRLYKGTQTSEIGIITHGGIFNYVFTTLRELGLADLRGQSIVDVLALNVTYPLDPQEIIDFAKGKEKIFIIEQGTPNFIEREIKNLLYDSNHQVKIYGKKSTNYGQGYIDDTSVLIPDTLIGPVSQFFLEQVPLNGHRKIIETYLQEMKKHQEELVSDIAENLLPRSPTFCSGCPERPVFAALKRAEEELDERFIRIMDIGCYLMSKLPPFNFADSCLGMGTALDAAIGVTNMYDKHIVAVMGDGTLFHGGMRNVDNVIHNNINQIYETHGIEKNKANVLLFVLLNYHTAMTGDQENPATLFDFHEGKDSRVGKNMRGEKVQRMNLENLFKQHGVKWVKTIDSYDIGKMKKTIHEALTIPGLKVIVSDGECYLERQRHERGYRKEQITKGKRWQDQGVQVDPRLCQGCWPCTTYIGCPSEDSVESPNPLKKGTIRQMDSSCVGCGVCSEVTQQFGLCPATYNTYTITNPTILERVSSKISKAGIGLLQKL